MEKFFNMVYRLKVVKRWGTSANIYEESVAEHSYFVAMIAYILVEIDKKLNNTVVNNMDKLIIKALYHDAFESYTTHIVSPLKKHDKNMAESTNSLKESYKKRILGLLPEECNDIIADIEESDKYIDTIIRIADSIESYSYCAFQVHIGNKDFINKLKIKRENIIKLAKEYNYVKFFFDNLFDEENFEIIY